MLLLSDIACKAWAMAKWVKIAVVAPAPPMLEEGLGYDQVVERMQEYWQRQLDRVLPDAPDLVVLPEACDRPANAGREDFDCLEYYRARGERMREFFANIAAAARTHIAYSAVRELDDGSFRNSTVLLDRSGQAAGVYDKCYPTIGEIKQGILPGTAAQVIACDFGRVGCAICFDLNFTELLAAYAAASPDLLLFSSMYHGGDVVQGWWSYSCRAYFVGAIAPGICPAQIRDPFGRVIAATNYFDHVVKGVNLDYCLAHIDFNQERFLALKQAYGTEVEIHEPGHVGSVMISSLGNKSAREMACEFGIELLDDYLARSRAERERG